MENVNRLGPELILLAMAGIVILADLAFGALPRRYMFLPRRALLPGLALAGVAGSILWLLALIATDTQGGAFSGTITVDKFSLFFGFLFASICAMIIVSSLDMLQKSRYQAEYLALVLASTAGLMLLASGRDIIVIYVSLEMVSISMYVLVAFLKDSRSSEAGLKYLLLGAVSSAVILYGMAFLYGLSGSTSLDGIADSLAAADGEMRPVYILAAVLLTAGLGFKMAVVPFQMWVPDVYEGAPTPITAYLSVGSKAAGFAVVMRIFLEGLGDSSISSDWANMFAVIAVVSMTVGNLLALPQTNIKRMLGYSSIAQAGNFLIGLAAVAANDPQVALGSSSVLFFLATYAFTNLGAFAAVIAISQRIKSDKIEDYGGMFRRAPLLALALVFCLLSLTGIPPTAGFVAKVYIFDAAVQADLVWLAVIGAVNSVISVYYYLRIAVVMYGREPEDTGPVLATPSLALALTVATAGVLVLGVFPFPLIEASEAAAQVFS